MTLEKNMGRNGLGGLSDGVERSRLEAAEMAGSEVTMEKNRLSGRGRTEPGWKGPGRKVPKWQGPK